MMWSADILSARARSACSFNDFLLGGKLERAAPAGGMVVRAPHRFFSAQNVG
ncbi:MAG: hypothetical protein QOG23_3870 [Blastocatellia bacterium]|nr:hypothetical protein [Blastocatellia bacterium]